MSTDGIPNNPAGRLHRLVSSIRNTNGQHALKAWVRVLDIDDRVSVGRERAVAAGLAAAHAQLDLVEAFLRHSGVRQESYEAGLNQMREGLAFRHLAGNWKTVQQGVGEPVPTVLAILSDLMDSETRSLDDTTLTELREAVLEIRKTVRGAALPDGLESVLHRYVDAFEQALWDYAIRGDEAFERAATGLSSALMRDASVLEQFKDRPEVGAVGWLWSQVAIRAKGLAYVSMVAGAILAGPNHLLQLHDRLLPMISDRASEPMIPKYLAPGGGGDVQDVDSIQGSEEDEDHDEANGHSA